MASIVSVKNVKKYFKDVKALDDVSFDIEEGKILGLLGPNGAGKTTIVNILATLSDPTEGSVEIFGQDLVSNLQYVRENIGLAGQFAAIDEQLTGRENLVMFGRLYHLSGKAAKERAVTILEQISLSQDADKPVKNYSGGMRRRLDLGASLMYRPKILFLDEPTTGLDPRTRSDLWRVIKSFVADGTTIVLTTQYLEEADELADRIVLIDRGKIVAEGTPAELKKQLGGAVIEVSPKSWSKARAIESIMDESLGLEVNLSESNQKISVAAPGGMKDLEKVLEKLRTAKISIDSIGLVQPSLDDVFLKFTASGDSDG